MYVAMTRARNHLAVTYPVNTYGSRWGAEYAIDQLSRFIDPGVREHMQCIAAYPAPEPAKPPGPDAHPAREGESLDLRALLRGRFGAR